MMNEKKRHKISLISIAGGSACGKTTIAKKIAESFHNKNVIFLEMDNYYQDLSNLSLEKRKKFNFDHPDAFDIPLLLHHLEQLLLGNSIEQPIYDFKVYNRSKKTLLVKPSDVIIFDGIFALAEEEIRNKSHIKIFVDTDSDIRLLRRIERDVELRGRSLKSVLNQYQLTVKPMHDAFVEPTKRFADIIIPLGGNNNVAIDLVTTKIKSMIK